MTSLTVLATMGQRRLQVAELLMTLARIAVNKQMIVNISQGGRPPSTASWSPIHCDNPEICTGNR